MARAAARRARRRGRRRPVEARAQSPWRANGRRAPRPAWLASLPARARRRERLEPRRAPARGRQPRAGAGDLARRGRRARGLGARQARSIRRTGRAAVVGFTGPPGVGKSTLIGALTKSYRAQDQRRRRAVDRPVLAVHQGRAARRPHPPDRALPRSRRVHPLDGQPRRAGRALGGGAPGRAAHGRRRQGRGVPRDRRASARPRSTSSTTPTRSCSCSCPARATRSRR